MTVLRRGSRGGKTDLGIGLALTEHKRSLLLRRINKDAVKIKPRIEEILGHDNGYNDQLQRWRLGERQIDIAGCEQESDEQRFKGDPHDMIVFDEGTDCLEFQYRFIIGWNRSTDPAKMNRERACEAAGLSEPRRHNSDLLTCQIRATRHGGPRSRASAPVECIAMPQ
jgi:hypothetical protein